MLKGGFFNRLSNALFGKRLHTLQVVSSLKRSLSVPAIPLTYPLIFLFLSYVLLTKIDVFEGYRLNDYMCLDFLRDGVLYGGQPYCWQGVIYYTYGLLLSFISTEHLNQVGLFFSICMNTLLFFLILKVMKSELGCDKIPLPILLFTPFFYLSLNLHCSVSLLATTFLFSGFYTLFYSKIKYSYVVSGILFVLSLYTSFITILPILFILLSLFFKLDENHCTLKNCNISLELNKLSTFLIIISIIILLSVGIYLMFPNIFIYTFTSHAYNNPKTFMGTISFIWSSTMESGIVVQLMVIILILLSGFIMLFDRVNILSAISSICFLFHLKNEFSTLGVGDLLDEYNFRFILPFIPFYIISVSIFCAKNKNIFYKAIIFSIIFSLLFYLSGLYESFPPGRGGRPPELIRSAYGLHFILPQEGRILMEGTVGHIREFISDFDLNISLNQIDPIPPMFKYDSYYDTNAYALSNLGITRDFGEFDKYEKKYSNIDYSFYDEDLLNEYTKRLCAGEYSLVIIAPPTWFTINLIANKKCSPLDDYCTLYIPFYEYLGHGGRTYATLYLRDWGQCKVIKKDVYNYYKNNFDILCQESEYLANNLIDSIGPFAATMPKCNSGNDFLTRYKLGTSLVTLNDLLLFVFVFLLSLYYLRQRT